jgi:predicted dehydrogenase
MNCRGTTDSSLGGVGQKYSNTDEDWQRLTGELVRDLVMHQDKLHFGVLGAAHIVPNALIKPAQQLAEVAVDAIAARDQTRARAFAITHGIPRVMRSYDEVIGASDIDAIYIPLPNSLHCEWTIRALRAGKHVLCEKPVAANEWEAERMAQVAQATGLVLAEALHYRYHPLASRVYQLLHDGTIGRIAELECHFSVPSLPTNIRFDWDLAGGVTMDLGCYLLNMIHYFSGCRPRVRKAVALTGPPNIDVAMEAILELEDGAKARMSCSMAPDAPAEAGFAAKGERGELMVTNPVAPHHGHRLTLKTGNTVRWETVEGHTTYMYQLRAFVAAVRGEQPMATVGSDGILNMRLIDEVYRAAGLPPRGVR